MNTHLHWIVPGVFLLISVEILAQSQTFNYTGAVQTYTVPACVFQVSLDVRGAAGTPTGSSFSAPGKGGRVQASLDVIPGEVLRIYVGQQPTGTTGGWNGGGNASSLGGAGGGASDVRQGGTALSNRVLVGGGGGGGGHDDGHVYINSGGDAGGLVGQPGKANNSTTFTYPGKGGTQTAGGAGGTGAQTEQGSPGTLGNGGKADSYYGGGGGGGYYGGGGGTANLSIYGGGGGGGSSFAFSQAQNVVHTAGFQSGNGQVILTPSSAPPPKPESIVGDSLICLYDVKDYSIPAVTGAQSYQWEVGGGAEIISGQGSTNIMVQWADTASNLSVSAATSCGESQKRILSVKLHPVLKAGFGMPDTALINSEVSFTDSSVGSNYIAWQFGDGDTSLQANPTHTYTQLGSFLVVQAVANFTCKDTLRRTIEIVDELNGISHRRDPQQIKVYPNPSHGKVYLLEWVKETQLFQAELLDLHGRAVPIKNLNFSKEAHEPTVLEFDDQLPGLYTLRWVTRDGKVYWVRLELIP